MAINLQDSTASYGFQKQQQQAVHIRITREMKEALERARTNGEATSIQMPGAGAGLVIRIGNHSYETHPPSTQERLHVFTKSQEGCTEVAQVHQRAVVKRSSLVNGQSAVSQVPRSQVLQQPHQVAQRLSSGPVQNGRMRPTMQQAEAVRKPHLQNGSIQPEAVPRPAGHQRSMAPPPQPRASHAPASANRQPTAPKPAQMRPPPPASGSHPSSAPPAHPPWSKAQAAQPAAAAQRGIENASAGASNQSAQTALAHKEAQKAKPGGGKATAAAGPSVQPDVLEKVCAIARREEKPNQPVMLAALLLCKPANSKAIEALMVEVEKRVRGFHRMQGQTLKGIYNRLSDFRTGGVRQLKPAFFEEAKRIVDKPTDSGAKSSDQHPPSAALHTIQPESTLGKKKQSTAERQMLTDRGASPAPTPAPAPTPISEPQSMHMDLPPAGPEQAAQGGENSKKKRKRLTKAADMLVEPQTMGVEEPASSSLQAADHESNGVDAAAGRDYKAQKTASGGRHATQQSHDHPSTTAGPSQQPAMLDDYQHRAGSLGAEGRTASGQAAPMTDAGPVQAGAAQPAGPKITLKLKRRWSAGSEDYDDSWFAQHVDRQPHRFGPVSSLPEFEEMVCEYDRKHAIYFKLHQEIQDLSTKVEGLQRAIRKAGSEAEKVKYQEQFFMMWNRRLPHSKRWDKAFATLHAELEAMRKHLQAFYDQHK